ncbi:MAG TPA: hypothetical protein VKB76_08025 [Ktedonobacterales bacterium]|nr:hypothetical protein [Ktedonobacterales bacterium]
MAVHPPHKPIIHDTHPRGRSGWATFGMILIVGGLVIAGLIVQGVIKIPDLAGIKAPAISNPFSATATPLVAPNGTAPTNFIAYHDPQVRYALYYSNTWASHDTTISINGQPQPAKGFAPKSSTLPSWTIAITPSAIPPEQLIQVVSDVLDAQGGSNVTPTNGPNPVTVGNYQWSQLDATVQVKGQSIQTSSFIRSFGDGSVLVIEEAIPLNYDATQTQDFTPMMTSLALHG